MSARRGSSLLAIALLVLGMTLSVSGQGPERGDEIRVEDKRSGYSFVSPETRAMQDDDLANPGFLWVLEGQEIWRTRAGAAGKSCADCH